MRIAVWYTGEPPQVKNSGRGRLVHRRAASGKKRWTGTVGTPMGRLGYEMSGRGWLVHRRAASGTKTADGDGWYTKGPPGVRNERTGTVGTQEGHLGYKTVDGNGWYTEGLSEVQSGGRGRLVHRRAASGTKRWTGMVGTPKDRLRYKAESSAKSEHEK